MNTKLDDLKSTLNYRVLLQKGPPLGFKNPPKADHTPFRITGGIGDLILGLGVAKALNAKIKDVVVYCKWPEISKQFSSLAVLKDEECSKNGFDFIISSNSIINFQIFSNFDGFKNQKLEEIYMKWRYFISKGNWKRIVEHHPLLDNQMAHLALKMGYNRVTLPYAFLGLQYVKTPSLKVTHFYSNYITIHDGFDSNNKEVRIRSMKNWDLDSWAELVAAIKHRFPNKKIVQLGGDRSRSIEGVDRNEVGQLTFRESMAYLENSDLHIDSDSGLVHAANFYGVPSVVLFGPTNAEFFGYDENLNIKSYYCGDCWWLKSDWMTNCPIGHDHPKCLDSIQVDTVFEAVSNFLNENSY